MAIFNPTNTKPFDLNSLKPKNTTTPLSSSLQTPSAQSFIKSLTAGGSSQIPKPKPVAVVSNNLSATNPTPVKNTPVQVKGTTQSVQTTPTMPVNAPQTAPISVPQQQPPQPPANVVPDWVKEMDSYKKNTLASNPKEAYVKYLSQYLAPSQQESDARLNLAKIQNEAQAKKTAIERQQEATLDSSGGLVSGAQQASNQIGTRGNRELADIALRQGAEANLLAALQGNRTAGLEGAKPLQIGNDFLDPSTGQVLYTKPDTGFSLGTGETYFTKDPITGEYKQVAAGTPKEVTSSSAKLDTSVVDVGGKKVLINNQTGETIRELAPGEVDPNAPNSPQNILTALKELQTLPGKSGAIGAKGPSSLFGILNSPIGGTDAAGYKAKLDTVKSLLTLPNLGLLKGAMSDNDLKFIQSAGTTLNNQIGEKQFDEELDKTIKIFEKAVTKTTLKSAGYSDAEINEYMGLTNVGSDTNKAPGKEIVAGYDITSYATNPKHGVNVQNIYNNIPNVSDSYIATKAPNSPIKASDVIASANKYGVDPKLVLAIMVEDSSLGTAGKAVRTKNPGNVGNDDTGALRTYSSWQEGIDAVAKNLAWRKINKNIA